MSLILIEKIINSFFLLLCLLYLTYFFHYFTYVGIGLDKGSTLGIYIFALIMD